MQIVIVDIKKSGACLHGLAQVIEEIVEMGTDQVGSDRSHFIGQEMFDDTIELSKIDRRPKSIFGAGMIMGKEEVQVSFKLIGQDQEPHLVGRPYIQDPLKMQRARRQFDSGRGVECYFPPAGMSFPV